MDRQRAPGPVHRSGLADHRRRHHPVELLDLYLEDRRSGQVRLFQDETAPHEAYAQQLQGGPGPSLTPR
ncbi:hypothetical protein [Streptomyces sp. NPDC051554]|uniref:hypothetical protein n=1 Tax=Streptomyces sp. NPDC051554 TaxID=3365656 RepID=UPI00378C7114